MDPSGRVHFIDTARDRIWRIELDGALTVVAHGAHANRLVIGPEGTLHYPPDSLALSDFALWNSRASGTQQDYDYYLDYMAVGNDGSLYRSRGNRLLRLRPDGSIAVAAGDTVPGYADGPAYSARFNRLLGLAVDSAGSVYVADYGNRRVRKISSDGAVTTVARIPWPWRPTGLAIWRDRVYLLERWGDYPGAPPIPWFISSYSFFADLLGHPRIRLIEPDGQSLVIASIASTRIRLSVALSALLGFVSLFLAIRRLRSRHA